MFKTIRRWLASLDQDAPKPTPNHEATVIDQRTKQERFNDFIDRELTLCKRYLEGKLTLSPSFQFESRLRESLKDIVTVNVPRSFYTDSSSGAKATIRLLVMLVAMREATRFDVHQRANYLFKIAKSDYSLKHAWPSLSTVDNASNHPVDSFEALEETIYVMSEMLYKLHHEVELIQEKLPKVYFKVDTYDLGGYIDALVDQSKANWSVQGKLTPVFELQRILDSVIKTMPLVVTYNGVKYPLVYEFKDEFELKLRRNPMSIQDQRLIATDSMNKYLREFAASLVLPVTAERGKTMFEAITRHLDLLRYFTHTEVEVIRNYGDTGELMYYRMVERLRWLANGKTSNISTVTPSIVYTQALTALKLGLLAWPDACGAEVLVRVFGTRVAGDHNEFYAFPTEPPSRGFPDEDSVCLLWHLVMKTVNLHYADRYQYISPEGTHTHPIHPGAFVSTHEVFIDREEFRLSRAYYTDGFKLQAAYQYYTDLLNRTFKNTVRYNDGLPVGFQYDASVSDGVVAQDVSEPKPENPRLDACQAGLKAYREWQDLQTQPLTVGGVYISRKTNQHYQIVDIVDGVYVAMSVDPEETPDASESADKDLRIV